MPFGQKQNGWHTLNQSYNDGGFSGGNLDRPALKQLLQDMEACEIDCVVVYKVDRLSRSLLDFARLLSVFEKRGVSFSLPRTNFWKISRCSRESTPMPRSRTEMATRWSRTDRSTQTVRHSGEYLTCRSPIVCPRLAIDSC